MLRNTADRYGLVSKVLHWLIAVGIIGLIALGAWMVGLGYLDPWSTRALSLHRAFGMAALALAVLFLLWRSVSPSPPLQDVLKPWEKLAARTAHILLMVAMVAIPLSGYMISTSDGSGFSFFGLFEIAALMPISEGARDLAIDAHYYMAYGVIAVIAAHAAGALKHQFIDRHGTLRRML